MPEDNYSTQPSAVVDPLEAKLTVFEDKVHCHFDLPGLLGMFAAPIAAALRAKGADILLEDHRP